MLILLVLACSETPSPPPPAPEPIPEEPAPPPLPDPTEPRYAGSHILLSWKGAVQAPPGVTRSREEARARAAELHLRALSGDFAALAEEHSDGPSAARGGRLGTWTTGTMDPAFERAVASVAPGEVGPVVETPFGFHIVRRDAIEEVEIAHLLVGWSGARRSDASRTREQARARIESLRDRLEAGESLSELAREHSDDGSAPAGGSLGRIARGQMVPAFEDAAFVLGVGERSGIVETPYGFHILLRTK